MTLELTGPPGLNKLDEATVRIRDDRPDRAAIPVLGFNAAQVAAVIWGHTGSAPGSSAPTR
jgi:hypothetical protein